MNKMKKIIIFSLLFIVIIAISIFAIFNKNENSNSDIKEELLQYGKLYYYAEENSQIDNENSYITFFSDNSCTTSMFPAEKCMYELIDNNKLFVSMDIIIKNNDNTSVSSLIEMYFEIIDEKTINCYSSKIGFDKESLVDGNLVGKFTTNYLSDKNQNNEKSEEWHKPYNLVGPNDNPYATIKLSKGNKCEIDFSNAEKTINLGYTDYMHIMYNDGDCSYEQTNDLDFIITYNGTFDVIHPVSQLSTYGNYVFQTQNQRLKITFKDTTYNSFNIINGEWDYENHAIYLKPNDKDNIDLEVSDNNESIDDKTYLYFSVEDGDTIKSIADKFEMDYNVLLECNNIDNINSQITSKKIKIPYDKMFSKLDDIYTNILSIGLFASDPNVTLLAINMKDTNVIILNIDSISALKLYPDQCEKIENSNVIVINQYTITNGTCYFGA